MTLPPGLRWSIGVLRCAVDWSLRADLLLQMVGFTQLRRLDLPSASCPSRTCLNKHILCGDAAAATGGAQVSLPQLEERQCPPLLTSRHSSLGRRLSICFCRLDNDVCRVAAQCFSRECQSVAASTGRAGVVRASLPRRPTSQQDSNLESE